MIASSIEQLGKDVHTTVEIMNENHIKSFKHVRVDDFLLSHEMISSLAVRSAISKGVTNLYSQLISRRHGDDLYQLKPIPEWKTYKDAFDSLLKDGATLVADHNQLDINRRLNDRIKNDSVLFIICDGETFKRINAKYNYNGKG